MKKNILIGFLAACGIFCSAGSAQVSTFPSPPPLAPKSNPGSDSTTNSPPGVSDGSSPGAPDEATGGSTQSGGAPPVLSPTNPPDINATLVTASTLNSMSALDDKVSLEAGDRISFRVIEDRDEA